MLNTILIIILAIIVIAIIFSIIKGIFKTAIFIIIIGIILLIVFGGMLVIDATNFKKGMSEGKNVFLLVKDNVAIEGISFQKEDDNTVKQESLDEDELNRLNNNLINNRIDEIKKEGINLIVIKTNDSTNLATKINNIFKGPFNIAEGIKSEEVQIYPENSLIKTLKLIPSKIIGLFSKD